MIKQQQSNPSCLGKLTYNRKDKAELKAKTVSKRFRKEYKVYRCQFCSNQALKNQYHLATVKEVRRGQILEYYRKPVEIKYKRQNILKRFWRATKMSYRIYKKELWKTD